MFFTVGFRYMFFSFDAKHLLLPKFLVSPVYYFNGEVFVVDYSPPIYNDGRREVVIILLCYSGQEKFICERRARSFQSSGCRWDS